MSKTWRRWLQFRLRTLLVAVTLTAVGLGVWNAYIHPYRLQRQAELWLSNRGARIQARTGGPVWLRWAAGDSFFRDAVEVHLEGNTTVRDGDLAVLARLPSLERLYLARTNIGDPAIQHIAGLKNLRRLSLWRTKATGRGLAQLAGLDQLTLLDVHGIDVTAEAIETFRALPSLRKVILDQVTIPPSHLAVLRRLPAERYGRLTITGLTDQDCRAFVMLITPDRLGYPRAREGFYPGLCLQGASLSKQGVMRLAKGWKWRRVELDECHLAPDAAAILPPQWQYRLTLDPAMSWQEVARRYGPHVYRLSLDRPGKDPSISKRMVVKETKGRLGLYCSEPAHSDPWRELGRFENLESLRIADAAAREDDLKILAGLPHLEDLSLAVPLGSVGIRHISAIPNLQSLGIGGAADLRGVDFSPLARAERLEELRIGKAAVDEAFLASIPRTIRISGSGLRCSPEVLARYSGDRTTSLCLRRSCYDASDTHDFASNPRGTHLELSFPSPPDNWDLLDRFSRIESMEIEAGVDSAGVWEHIAHMTSLRGLRVQSNSVPPDALKYLLDLKELVSLSFHHCDLSAGHLKHLRQDSGILPNLRFLTLQDCGIDDQTLAHLSRLNSLPSLDLYDNPITDAGLEHLAGLKGLKSISLNGCRTTRQGRDALNARLNCRITH